jgi:hypothetical protein
MIHYLVTRGHDRYTMRAFRRWWAGPLRDRIRILEYERLPRLRAAEPGLYVFSDLERLTQEERAAAAGLHARLAAAGPGFRLLNDPSRSLGRRDLLRVLHERGVNAFRAFRPAEAHAAAFPVFVRTAAAHDGSLTGLLRDPRAVEAALRRVRRPGDLLVVEFVDTADAAGTYRKYAAMRIGDALLARHLLFGEHWVVKKPGRLDAERLREEEAFLASFPHRDQVLAAFGIAGIDYGRMDYAVRDGRIQVFEINTNPVLVPPPRRIAPGRRARQLGFAAAAGEALAALDRLPAAPAVPLRLRWPRGGLFARALTAVAPRWRRP